MAVELIGLPGVRELILADLKAMELPAYDQAHREALQAQEKADNAKSLPRHAGSKGVQVRGEVHAVPYVWKGGAQ